MKRAIPRLTATGALVLAAFALVRSQPAKPLSHPPLRPLPEPADRPRDRGPAYFVDAARGDDRKDGSEKAPWKTVNHALRQLSAGDTLYLRGGTYAENVYCAVAGTADKPITIRSFPGEQAVIDVGIPEFRADAASAWVAVEKGAPGEYRSAKAYRNVR